MPQRLPARPADFNAGGACHVTDWSLFWEPWLNPGASAELLTVDLTPGQELQVQQWYTFGTVRIDGPVCSMLLLDVTLTFEEEVGGGQVTAHELHSNVIIEHVVPEPHATALLTGGLFALLLRRRRRRAA